MEDPRVEDPRKVRFEERRRVYIGVATFLLLLLCYDHVYAESAFYSDAAATGRTTINIADVGSNPNTDGIRVFAIHCKCTKTNADSNPNTSTNNGSSINMEARTYRSERRGNAREYGRPNTESDCRLYRSFYRRT